MATLWVVDSGAQQGVINMATDDALLTWLQSQPPNTWVIHSYQWQPATLSVGIHQREDSIQQAYEAVTKEHPDKKIPITRRPTGGRAIFHYQDISFAIATNAKQVLNASLPQRYNNLSQPLITSLTSLGHPPLLSGSDGNDNHYAAHPLCFTSHTPWDILHPQTKEKLAGCAQVVRKYGILQHGAVFIEKLDPTPPYSTFTQHLINGLASQLGCTPQQLSKTAYTPILEKLTIDYTHEAKHLQQNLCLQLASKDI
jgi:lipoate-protein ligase A